MASLSLICRRLRAAVPLVVSLGALAAVAAGCGSGAPPPAGVERVHAQVKGITWAACAATMEVALRRHLEGVSEVAISLSEQTTEVRFAGEGHAFSPATFREAVGTAGVEVLKLEIDACGTIETKGDERWLAAGKNRYLLTGDSALPLDTLLLDTTVCVTGRLIDRPEPQRIEVARVEPVSSK